MAFHWLIQRIAIDAETNKTVWEEMRYKKNANGELTEEIEGPALRSVPPALGEQLKREVSRDPRKRTINGVDREVFFRWKIVTKEHDVGRWVDTSKVGRQDMLWGPNPDAKKKGNAGTKVK